MDGEKVTEDFDNLWFFSNIFSSPSPSPPPPSLSCTCSDGKITQFHLPELPISKLQIPSAPIPQTKRVEALDIKDHVQTSSYLESSLQHVESVEMESVKTTEPTKNEQRSKTDRKSPKSSSKRRVKDQRQQMQFNAFMEFRDFGFSFVDIELDDELVPMAHMFQRSTVPYYYCKMPPLDDGLAMKEHLKSWACAVASTVR